MNVSIFAGDLADAPAEALCTSTNPRLSLVMGTGASVRDRGGFEILRACEAIVAAEQQRSGNRGLPPGSAHATTPGSLPCKVIIHCVASDLSHRSSAEIVKACVQNALAHADAFKCRSLALPMLATGHAHLNFAQSLAAILDAVRESATLVEQIILVIADRSMEDEVRRAIRARWPGAEPESLISPSPADESTGGWLTEE